MRKNLNTNAWKNNFNHPAIFDDHNDEQVDDKSLEDGDDDEKEINNILNVLHPLYSQSITAEEDTIYCMW